MEKLLKLMQDINEKDKLDHFFYGFFIYNISIYILLFFFPLFISSIISFSLVFIIAFLKEVYDFYHPNHKFSIMDIVYTIIPGIIQTLILFYF